MEAGRSLSALLSTLRVASDAEREEDESQHHRHCLNPNCKVRLDKIKGVNHCDSAEKAMSWSVALSAR